MKKVSGETTILSQIKTIVLYLTVLYEIGKPLLSGQNVKRSWFISKSNYSFHLYYATYPFLEQFIKIKVNKGLFSSLPLLKFPFITTHCFNGNNSNTTPLPAVLQACIDWAMVTMNHGKIVIPIGFTLISSVFCNKTFYTLLSGLPVSVCQQ